MGADNMKGVIRLTLITGILMAAVVTTGLAGCDLTESRRDSDAETGRDASAEIPGDMGADGSQDTYGDANQGADCGSDCGTDYGVDHVAGQDSGQDVGSDINQNADQGADQDCGRDSVCDVGFTDVSALDDISDTDAATLGTECDFCARDEQCQSGFVCVELETPGVRECFGRCFVDSDCDSSKCVEWQGAGYCEPANPCLPRCDPDAPVIDPETGTCVQCLVDSHCSNDQYCDEFSVCSCIPKECGPSQMHCSDCACGECCESADCETGEVCFMHECVGPEQPCDDKCAADGLMCHSADGEAFCVDCHDDTDCSGGCTCNGSPAWTCVASDGTACSK